MYIIHAKDVEVVDHPLTSSTFRLGQMFRATITIKFSKRSLGYAGECVCCRSNRFYYSQHYIIPGRVYSSENYKRNVFVNRKHIDHCLLEARKGDIAV